MTQLADKLHRLVKQRIDSGAAASLEEAEAHFEKLQLVIEMGEHAGSPAHHSALLTAVALGRRTFLGGVFVTGALDVESLSPLAPGVLLRAAVQTLGGESAAAPAGLPLITIGTPANVLAGFHVRVTFSGWRGGVVPANSPALDEENVVPLAAMLAASIAIAEAYGRTSGEVIAGRREVGLSLWRPDVDWRTDDGAPLLRYLPSQLWLIGLGHLGQAYLWGLGLLPFSADQLTVVLQDFDSITASTESTSILSDQSMVGRKKTRATAEWAERRGFKTVITERAFDRETRVAPNEPQLALCGLDSADARRALDHAGFKLVVEAGLGDGFRDFRSVAVHTITADRPATSIWKSPTGQPEPLSERPAYLDLVQSGVLDECGATTLAGVSVGAPWVGAFASALVLAEVLRLLNGGTLNSTISVDVNDLENRQGVARKTALAFNPGFVSVAQG